MFRYENNILLLCEPTYPIFVEHVGFPESVEEHGHDFYEMVFIEQGFTVHKTMGHPAILLAGDVFCIRPFVKHEYLKDINNKAYNCYFTTEVFGDDFSKICSMPVLNKLFQPGGQKDWFKIHLSPLVMFEAMRILNQLTEETQAQPPEFQTQSKALFMSLMVLLSRTGSALPTLTDPDDAAFSAALLRGLQMFSEHPGSIGEAAAACGYTRDHFSRLFKHYTGISPLSYQTSLKITAAAEALLHPGTTVAEAAETAGFCDQNYFARLFKKETGLTPSQFQERQR